MPGERLVAGVLVEIAEHLRAGLAAEQRHRRARGDVDEPAEREHDADHHAGEDAGREHADDRCDSDPEVEPRDPAQPAQLGQVDHPEHDGVDDHRGEHRLSGRSENSGASTISVSQHERACDQRRNRRPGSGRLVQRAGGEAGGDRHALEHAGAHVRHALSHRLLVDVDAVLVPGGERARVAGGLREPDQQQRDRPRRRSSRGAAADRSRLGQLRRRQPARDVPDQRDPVRAEVEQRTRRGSRRRRAPAPRERRARAKRRPRITPSATAPTRSVVPWTSPSEPIHEPSSRQALSPSADVPVSFGQLADHHVDRGAGQEARDHRLGEEPRDPPHPQHGEQEEQHARDQRDRRDQLRGLLAAEAGDQHRASGDGGQGRARPGRDLPRRAEERVDDRARGRRVQPVLQRHSGDPRVAEVLRHDQRGHRDPRGNIAAQPAAVVAGQPTDDREQAGQAATLVHRTRPGLHSLARIRARPDIAPPSERNPLDRARLHHGTRQRPVSAPPTLRSTAGCRTVSWGLGNKVSNTPTISSSSFVFGMPIPTTPSRRACCFDIGVAEIARLMSSGAGQPASGLRV